jgi:hypothetical protein
MATYTTALQPRTDRPLVTAALTLALIAVLAAGLGLWIQAVLDALSRLVLG